jgi:predicted ATPase
MPNIYSEKFDLDRPGFLGGGKWKLAGFNEITILFGKNGNGKSQLLRMIRNSQKAYCHYASPERAGNIDYNANIFQDEGAADANVRRRSGNLAPEFRREAIARIQIVLMKLGERSLLGKPRPEALSSLERDLNFLVPEFQLRIVGRNPPFELKRLSDDSLVTSIEQISSGEGEVFGLALDLMTACAVWEIGDTEKRLLLIDEPDTHLHPDLQQSLAAYLVTLGKTFRAQLIVATHSTTLLSALGHYGADKVSVLFLRNQTTEQKALRFNDEFQELSACLGGHALMGPLFGAPLLLVEGDDDYRIWSQVSRHPSHQKLFSVLPCSGADSAKNYQKVLESIFGSIRTAPESSAGFVILDGDQNVPDGEQRHVKFLKLNCHEAENLYLTGEVLVELGTTWAQAKAKIKEQAEKYGNKAEALRGCDGWDRQKQDVKTLINEIADILDTKKLPWTLRLGKIIGKGKPAGELADFLGEQVLTALWP